jgi:predicted ester cyclase
MQLLSRMIEQSVQRPSRCAPGDNDAYFAKEVPMSQADQEHQATEAIAVVRRNTEEVQGRGDFALFERLFAPDFIDHTPQRGFGADREAVRALYCAMRTAFPDFHPEIHFQFAAGTMVTTYKTYHGTHSGPLLGHAATGKRVRFDSVDVMKVVDGRIVAHWGVGDLLGLMIQIGAVNI